MRFFSLRRVAPLAAIAALLLVLPACSPAAPFEFTSSATEAQMGPATVEVRLKNNASGTFVEDAVITATHLDMAPDGMSQTTSPIEAAGTSGGGVYRFKTNFTMTGKWALSLSAHVPGQAEPVRGTLVFTVK